MRQLRGVRAALIVGLVLVVTGGAAFGVESATGGSTPRPRGVPGNWKEVFDAEFNGHGLDRDAWSAHDGWTNQNRVTDELANVAVRDGHAVLTLASPSSGAAIATRYFRFRIGEYAEARILFAGQGRTVYNWPAWWASGPNWPVGGENDIAEGFGELTVNYHSSSVTHLMGPIPGDWAGGFHTYGIYRGRYQSRVYWDGRLVATYRTDDSGQPETLVLTLGAGNTIRTGASGAMVVDYVRVWKPA